MVSEVGTLLVTFRCLESRREVFCGFRTGSFQVNVQVMYILDPMGNMRGLIEAVEFHAHMFFVFFFGIP